MWPRLVAALRRLLGASRLLVRLGLPFMLGFAACMVLRGKKKKKKKVGAPPPRANGGAAGDDGDPMAFLNCVIQVLWPHITAFVREDIIMKTVQPMLKEKLGDSLSITKFSLGGGSPPRVDSITAEPYQRPGMQDRGVVLKVPLELNFAEADSVEVEIAYKFIKVGLAHLRISGDLLIYLRPLLSRVPFLGGMEIAFENSPKIEVDFSGIGQVVEIPGLEALVFRIVDNALASFLVLPNRFAITWDPLSVAEPVQASQLNSPAPEGVLRIRIMRASGLQASDVSLGGGSSDPFVRVKLGNQTRKTPVISKTLEPEWSRENTFDFLVYDHDQRVEITVFDHDKVGGDDLLGEIPKTSVQDLIGANFSQMEHSVDLVGEDDEGGEGGGTLTFYVEWLDALGDGELCNSAGAKSILSRNGGHDGKTQLHYCGRVVGKSRYHPCSSSSCTTPGTCDGVCGPTSGCQCESCYVLDFPMEARPSPDDPNFHPMEYPIDSMSDVHHVVVSSRAGEQVDLARDSVIISARLGIPGVRLLDVTQKLHHLFVKGHSCINAKSFNWEKIQRNAGLNPTQAPIGILRMTVLRANNLIADDKSLFGESSSDPYVQVTVGKQTEKTDVVSKTLNPEWSTANVFDFPVHSRDELVGIEVLDYDLTSGNDSIGKARDHTVLELVNLMKEVEHTVQLGEGPSGGTLTFLAQWRDAPSMAQRMLSVAYAVPPRDADGSSGQDRALLEVCLNSVTGLPPSLDMRYKLRVEVKTGEHVHTIEPQEAWGFSRWRDPGQIEEQIDNLIASMPAASETTAESRNAAIEGICHIGEGSVEMLLRMRKRNDELDVLVAHAKDEGHPHEELDEEREKLRQQWEALINQSYRKLMSSSNPVFDKVVYMTVPVTFEYVQVLLVTKDNKALCGLRFRAQHGHSDGCLGLRRARATETKDTRGYYEALTCGASPKKQPKGQTVTEERATVAEGKTRCKAGPLIEGPFSLRVPDSSRADPNAPLPELDGFLRLRTLVPRSPPGSTVRPKQQAGAGRSPRKWKRKGAGASGRSSSSPDKASPGAASTGSGGGGGGRDSPPSTPGPVSAADAAAVAQALESAAGSLALKASPPPPGSLNLEPVKWHWGGSEPEPELEPELEPEPEPERQ